MSDKNVILKVNYINKTFVTKSNILRKIKKITHAVKGISFDIKPGETFALVGESGCGKTTTGKSIIRSIPLNSGSIEYTLASGKTIDVTKVGKNELRLFRQEARMIFQNPYSSLNPRMNVFKILSDPLINNKITNNKNELKDRVVDVLKMVHLDPDYMKRYPHAFSGGQRQRIAIGRALILNPKFVIADEPVSALDVSVQSSILNLLKELQEIDKLTYLFIAHNLAVVRYQSDRVAVMYLGKIMELADNIDLFSNPRHPYTELLLASSPGLDPENRKIRSLKNTRGIYSAASRGCLFAIRCNYATQDCFEKET